MSEIKTVFIRLPDGHFPEGHVSDLYSIVDSVEMVELSALTEAQEKIKELNEVRYDEFKYHQILADKLEQSEALLGQAQNLLQKCRDHWGDYSPTGGKARATLDEVKTFLFKYRAREGK